MNKIVKYYSPFANSILSKSLLADHESFFDDIFEKNKINFPEMDIYMENNNYYIEILIPGVEKDNIKVELKSNGINVSIFNLSEGTTKEDKKYYSKEIRKFKNDFYFNLPKYINDNMNRNNIDLTYENGILTIKISLKEKELQEEIKVLEIK